MSRSEHSAPLGLDAYLDAFPRVWLFDEETLYPVIGDRGVNLANLREAARCADARVLCRELFSILRAEAVLRRRSIQAGEPALREMQAGFDPDVADLLYDLCAERTERRIGAVEELYGMEAFRLQDGLVRSLDVDGAGVRWLAAQALVALELRLIVPDLLRMIRGNDEEGRYLARCALAHLASVRELDLVLGGVWENDGSGVVALRGLRRLLKIDPEQVAPQAIAPLTRLADHPQDIIRALAAELLGEIAEVYPALELRAALPVLCRRASRMPWTAQGTPAAAAAREECRLAAKRIHQATKSRRSLPLPVRSAHGDGRDLPRPSGGDAVSP